MCGFSTEHAQCCFEAVETMHFGISYWILFKFIAAFLGVRHLIEKVIARKSLAFQIFLSS